MASKNVNWTAILADFVKRHPKTSATIAFNLGVFAAQAAKSASKGGKAFGSGVTEIPAKLIELVPSMKDLGTYVPMLGGKPAAKRKTRRAPARKTANKTASKSARKSVKRVARRAAG